ncbi:MAG: pyruvate:ferredoxin (flavodoxin) oxidoreductase, partial [Clostridia bacterium]|nr:pyruvate:ferredoxin (flavodoxin) oxidoreductase [Clostridia bacterium]
KDTTPADFIAVYRNLDAAEPKKLFTLSINDDVTNLSLDITENPDTAPKDMISCKFWGLGSDGTVGANKNSIKIIGDHTDKYVQAYFAYDSKKSGGVTISHLHFGDSPIRSTYFVSKADFVACHNLSYVDKYDITKDIKDGGTFLLNTHWTEEEIEKNLPNKMKRDLAEKNARFFVVDGVGIAREIGLGNRINMILQSAFFKLAAIIPLDEAVGYMKEAIVKSYGKKGEKVVAMNQAAVDRGIESLKEITVRPEWKDLPVEETKVCVDAEGKLGEYVENVLIPVNAQKGDLLPVSTFVEDADGIIPQGSAAFEKRGIAVDVPCWIPEYCIQCNFCSYVCPHAAIRPAVMKAEEAPEGMKLADATGLAGYKFGMTVSVLDCTGCGSCSNVCPGKKGEKALVMKPLDTQRDEQKYFAESYKHADNEEVLAKFKPSTVKGSQFKQPLLEFSGACPGCGETPYAKLITQLFGDRMFIANATGCSSIWGGSSPASPYTVNKEGNGPTWANSLFEDNAEYGMGMAVAVLQRREKLVDILKEIRENSNNEAICAAIDAWMDAKDDGEASKAASRDLIALLEGCDCELAKEALARRDLFVKKSIWILGGDGWAYDIGFGGLDHAIASGLDINILVFDTEVYSNTGGQASKSTPTGAIAQFAAAGMETKKKDLAAIAMSYGYVYVAQVAMGKDYNQCIKAFTEAESYKGPSIVIAYAPCINHGIKMSNSMAETKKAVDAGYWHMFRYSPARAAAGEKAFVLDSKEPTESYRDFILGETRYASLTRSFPDRAEKLFAKAEEEAAAKTARLIDLNK